MHASMQLKESVLEVTCSVVNSINLSNKILTIKLASVSDCYLLLFTNKIFRYAKKTYFLNVQDLLNLIFNLIFTNYKKHL